MTSFISGNGCPVYFEYSEMLLYNKEENELRKACLEAVHDGLPVSYTHLQGDVGTHLFIELLWKAVV